MIVARVVLVVAVVAAAVAAVVAAVAVVAVVAVVAAVVAAVAVVAVVNLPVANSSNPLFRQSEHRKLRGLRGERDGLTLGLSDFIPTTLMTPPVPVFPLFEHLITRCALFLRAPYGKRFEKFPIPPYC